MTDAATFFSLPVGANPSRDQRVGTDELGRPVYRSGNGQQYSIGETYRQPRETAPGSMDRVRETVGNLIRGAADSFVSGVTAPARALQGQPVTYGDALETAGMAQLGGAAMPAPQGALRSGALRMAGDVAETPAQQVARLLREGRAPEITDDLMAQADDYELFRLYEAGDTGMPMPMDEASRMARAGEMGFDTGTPLYHGTDREFEAFSPSHAGRVTEAHSAQAGTWATSSPRTAETYADFSANSVPVRDVLRRAYDAEDAQNWDLYDTLMREAEDLEQTIGQNPERGQNLIPLLSQYASPTREYMGRYPSMIDAEGMTWQGVEGRMRGALGEAREYGMRGFDIENLSDAAEYGVYDPAFHTIRFQPESYRSRFARFDPRLSHLANLSAANASPMTGIMGAQAGNREEELQRLAAYLAENGGLN